MKMEQIECSETSEYNNQTPGKYPKEYIQDSKHGESLKSRITNLLSCTSKCEVSVSRFMGSTKAGGVRGQDGDEDVLV